jgi:aspartyl-tRNA(Asn)/glutamyl-tRNA(Gln) amidotransferase subunit A
VCAPVGDGITLGVKDLFDTAGVRTTYGSAIFRDHVPDRTAAAVTLLEEAGYVMVGKTNLHEFAYGVTSENEHWGDVVNPLDPERIPGGSSGGSAAALAAGLCDAALGTDTGGSIRVPAACCGIVGFKPTHGRMPLDGVYPLAPSFDHAGPMARTVAECAAAAHVLDPTLESTPIDPADLHIGVIWLDEADPLVRARVEEAAAHFGRATPVEFPFPDGVTPVFMREAADVHRDLFAEHADLYGRNVRAKIERCLEVTDEEYEAGLKSRARYREVCAGVAAGFDLLVAPTLTTVAPRIGQEEIDLRWSVIRLTFPFNALGWPVLAVPCGLAEDGLPASVSLIGTTDQDGLVLHTGLAFERVLSPV